MTMNTLQPDPVAWEAAVTKYKTSLATFHRLINEKPERMPVRAGNNMVRAHEKLFELVAPDIEAVITKLMIRWEDCRDGDTLDAMQRCKIIGDLRRLSYGEHA